MKQIRVNVRGRWYTVEVGDLRVSPVEVEVEGERFMVEVGAPGTGRVVGPAAPSVQKERREAPGLRGIVQSGQKVERCPMPGRILAVSVEVGQQVEEGDEMCVLETMKMEQSIRFSQSGTVKAVFIQGSDSVQTGEPLIELE